MARESTNARESHAGMRQFNETRWSLVLAAGQNSSPGKSAALDTLCRSYWYPVYAYVRKRGYQEHDAQDLTQEFFARILKQNLFASADRQKGKFRTYLLAALNNFLADEWDKLRAQKRGGGATILSLDDQNFESRFQNEPATDLTPEKIYDNKWMMVLLEQSIKKLRQEFMDGGKVNEFDLLKSYLTDASSETNYNEVAAKLGTNPKAIAVSVFRLRKRFRNLLREEIAETVSTPAEVDQELRHLMTR